LQFSRDAYTRLGVLAGLRGQAAEDRDSLRDLEDGYRWRLRAATGETLATSSRGHKEKSSCYDELRSAMAEHRGADILDVSVG
jgi:uncharacterized protein YegP (UPF0339 family)